MGKARPTIPPLPREGGSYVLDAKAGRWEPAAAAAGEPIDQPAPLADEAQDNAADV
jgi:hypothetical protein